MMRITNSMMLNNTKININKNKVNVDCLNTMMSTQKKITKPSDNPLIAVRSLRLTTTLSQINQYCNTNISDAQSWLDVTETALENMKNIISNAYELCVYGSNDVLTEDDRNTILTQLKGLSEQLYAEANTDYAGRTVFSGYKTNSTVTFTDATEAALAKYEITEQLSASSIQSYSYYANTFDTPTISDIENQTAVGTPAEEVLKRLRLAYSGLSNISSFSYNYAVDTSSSAADGTTTGNVTITIDADTGAQTLQWRSLQKDSAFTYQADENGDMTGATFTDMNGYSLSIASDGKISFDSTTLSDSSRTTTLNNVPTKITTYSDTDGNTVFTVKTGYATGGDGKKTDTITGVTITDAQGNQVKLNYTDGELTSITDAQGNTITTSASDDGAVTITNADNETVLTATPSEDGVYELYTADKEMTTNVSVVTMTAQEFEEYLTALAADPDTVSEEYANTVIYLPDTGELILGTNVAEVFSSESATLNVTYDKNGFSVGEVRPEMYFNCTNKTDASAANHITYTNYDEDGNWIYQDINYTVSTSQELTINTQIHDVLTTDCYRDLVELTNIVQAAIDANATVTELKSMIDSGEYADEELAYLEDCYEKAQKQAAYADDQLQSVFGTQITNFENYLSKVNLAITDVGSRGSQLDLAKNRMTNLQTTFTELKSNNEDVELSDVVIDYTAAYYAYQACLQAAGKLDDFSLLDFI